MTHEQDIHPPAERDDAVVREFIEEGNAKEEQNGAEQRLLVKQLDAGDLKLLVISRHPDGINTARHDSGKGEDGTDGSRFRVLETGTFSGVKVGHGADAQTHRNEHESRLTRDRGSIEEEVESSDGRRQEYARCLVERYGAVLQGRILKDDAKAHGCCEGKYVQSAELAALKDG